PALSSSPPRGRRNRDLRSQLVQSRRRRARHGFLYRRGGALVPEGRSARREGDGQFRNPPPEILAGGKPRGTTAASRAAHRRRAKDLEAFADGPQILQPLVRLLAGAGRNVRGHGYLLGALVCRSFR